MQAEISMSMGCVLHHLPTTALTGIGATMSKFRTLLWLLQGNLACGYSRGRTRCALGLNYGSGLHSFLVLSPEPRDKHADI
jgi:hypothetical protein